MGRVKEALSTCPDCDGDGGWEHPVGPGRERGFAIEPDWEWEDCPRCDGAGQVLDPAIVDAEQARLITSPDADSIAETHELINLAREEDLARLAAAETQLRQPHAH